MNINLRLGDYNDMTVTKAVDFGVYLDGGDAGEILLPTRYVPANCKPGDVIRIFLYLDSEERLIATTLQPLAKVGEFACLEVNWTNKYGAFLNWGLMKDLFCPFREQKMQMEQQRKYVVYVYLDDESYRLVASAKVEKFLSDERPPYQVGQAVDVMVWKPTDMGYKVIAENLYQGMIYQDEIFRELAPGQHLQAFVRNVRDDNRIDFVLQQDGLAKVTDFSKQLLEYIRHSGGHTSFGDKTDAELIYDTFHVSKKTFKKAVGDLYKKRLIKITPEGICLS